MMQRKDVAGNPGFGASPAPAKPMTNLVEQELPQTERRPAVSAARPRSRAKFVVIPVVLLAIAAAGITAYLHFQNRVTTDDATVDGHISAVAPKIAGNVVEVLVKDNQPVKAGDVLVRIDPRDFQAKVAQAKASVLQAESQLQSARQVVPWTNETTQSALAAAGAQLADTNAELERAHLAYEQASGADLAFAEANVR